jgi:DNA polymerase-1
MLVDLEQFKALAEFVATSQSVEAVALDFETTGLRPRAGARAFLLGISVDGTTYSYFFEGGEVEHEAVHKLVSNPRIKYLAHNAKFEMGFLMEQWGAEIKGHVWDTEVMARLQYNNHRSYSLQNCAERIGNTKYPPMLAWNKKYGHEHYDYAPIDIIIEYVEHDAQLSWLLFIDQRDTFREWHKSDVPPAALVSLEVRTTKNLFKMERIGLRLDVEYARRALAHERGRAAAAKEEFGKLTGVSFVDSAKTLTPVFDNLKLPYGKTEKGGDSFNSDALLPHAEHSVVKCILEYRNANKRASTYWENFLTMHVDGYLYPEIWQAGAATGRFSVTNPACQTWPDDFEDPTEYPIRRALIAPEGCDVVSMDYKGMELRFEVDQAECEYMINVILTGADMHQRVADAAGVPRSLGKRGRFLRQYGGGIEKMSKSLGISMDMARRIAKALDEESPAARGHRRGLINSLKYGRRFGYNWMGRRYFFDKGFEYKYPNYWNQGGCSEILRVAIDDITILLEKYAHPATRIVLPIHDELALYWDKRDRHLIPEVKELMIKAYRIKKTLGMDVSAAIGPNFHDLTELE